MIKAFLCLEVLAIVTFLAFMFYLIVRFGL